MIEAGAYYEKISCERTENKNGESRCKQQTNLFLCCGGWFFFKIISRIQKAHAIFQLYLATIAIKWP
jgi:hypothetical protein